MSSMPKKKERKDIFISRCIQCIIKDKPAKTIKQATAICNGIWLEKKS